MKDILDTNNNSAIKDDVEGIKEDIENLVNRLGKLKDHSVSNLNEQISEQIDLLSETLTTYKEKGTKLGKSGLVEFYSSTRRHPLRNLLYAFGAGIALACILKK